MAEDKMSRRSFMGLSAATAASLVVDWRKINALAAGMGDKTKYPVVVIGAGLGGLCAAGYLSKYGIPITVVEQHAIPGGYATAFKRRDFNFEVSLHLITVNNNSTATILKELGILDKLQVVPLPGQQDPESLAATLAGQYPSEEEGIKGFIREITGISDEISDLAKRKGQGRTPLAKYPKISGVQGKTLDDLLNNYLKDQELRDMLASGWGAYGLPPSRLSAFYFAAARGGSLKNGSYYIRPRSQTLSNALAETVTHSGGKILYRIAARNIRVKDGAVEGVELEDGRVLPAAAVVSNASALTTFQKMLPPGSVPADYLKKLDGYSTSISTFIVWLGLNEDIRGIVKAYRTGFRTGRGIEADYQSCMNGDIERVPYTVTVYDHLFDGYSKPGKSTVTLLCLCGYEPWRVCESDYRAGRKSLYYKEKERWPKALIARAEKDFIPGLSSMIGAKDSATPLTNWYYTRNPEGAIYGFNQTVDNSFMNRLDGRTPIKGLYLAGAWGNPGGGYGGALSGGEKAFRMMMADWGKSAAHPA
jgi:phytoene dehydrogenase-like protein